MNHIATSDPASALREQSMAARVAARVLATAPDAQRREALLAASRALRSAGRTILAANAADVAQSQAKGSFLDRLRLDDARLAGVADGVAAVAELPDPVGRVLAEWTRPNGLRLRRVSVPIGVIGMIYESRPNVGADAGALCLRSGNAVLLRGGSESARSAVELHAAMAAGLIEAGLPAAAIQVAPTTDRAYVAAMLGASGQIDLIVPRGGKSLVERVQAEARVPVLAHGDALNHTFVHRDADPEMAHRVLANAKMRRTGVCGATETLLIDAACAPMLLPGLVAGLRGLGCRCLGDIRARAIVADLEVATPQDFHTEWLDAVLSIAVVDGVDDAIDHIGSHGSAHTEAIITEDAQAAAKFLNGVDAAVVMWNASTQFCDGGEFGFGAEIGIATGRLHARGPVGLEQLTTYRYEVIGSGQTRP